MALSERIEGHQSEINWIRDRRGNSPGYYCLSK